MMCELGLGWTGPHQKKFLKRGVSHQTRGREGPSTDLYTLETGVEAGRLSLKCKIILRVD